MRRLVTVLASLVLAGGGGLVAASPAAATGSHGSSAALSPYVALGDSYSAGYGVQPVVPGSPPACSRSLLNYPHDIAFLTRPQSFTDVTCGGATTADFFTPQSAGGAQIQPAQLDAVNSSTRLVTMTIGGNDGGAFSNILRACVAASAASGSIYGDPCADEYKGTFDDIVKNLTYPDLVAALEAVHQKAPDATVAILGYPHALPRVGVPSCYPAVPISMGDVPYVNDWAATLDTAVEKAAAETGTRFIDMGPSSVGHDACQPPWRRWIEPLNGPINAAPAHPNAVGEAAMAAQTLRQLRY